jgi:hypothetical protein
VASWTVLHDQTVRISARATSFTVVCDACGPSMASDGYGRAAAHGTLPLERVRGRVTCPNGHQLRVERDSL